MHFLRAIAFTYDSVLIRKSEEGGISEELSV